MRSGLNIHTEGSGLERSGSGSGPSSYRRPLVSNAAGLQLSWVVGETPPVAEGGWSAARTGWNIPITSGAVPAAVWLSRCSSDRPWNSRVRLPSTCDATAPAASMWWVALMVIAPDSSSWWRITSITSPPGVSWWVSLMATVPAGPPCGQAAELH